MTRARKYKRTRGTLHIVCALFVASALVRLSAQASPAMAQEVPEVIETQVTAEPNSPEIDTLLAALQAREELILERETQLRERIDALGVAEVEIETKLASLIAAEEQLSATIALAASASETDLVQLKSVYESMKPKEAAELFEQMPPQFAAGFLGMMRPEVAALIMTELDPEIAYSFSVVLAGRNASVPTQ